jgi:hypothetical protein
MADWKTLSLDEKLSDEDPHKGKTGHVFYTPKKMVWLTYCSRCGHIALKNKISTMVTKLGCGFASDGRYQQWLKNPASLG